MSAKSERQSDLNDRRIVPYDFGIGDMWKLEQELWSSYGTSARLASKGEINPLQAAGRMLTSTFDFWKNMFVAQDQEERVWITRDDPETGQTIVLPADIRERPPTGKLVSSLWQVPKGWLGRARQSNPAVDVLAHGVNGIISLARLGVDLGPFGYARASVLGKDDANKGRFTALDDDHKWWQFWDRFRTSWTWWGELLEEDLESVVDTWGAGIDMMEGHFERNPLFPVRGETFSIQPEWERNLLGIKTVTKPPINMDLVPEHLRKPYDEMTKGEKAELLELQFEAQSLVSSYQYRYWFDKIKEQNPSMSIEQVRLDAAEIAWTETRDQPLPSEVADGFGDIMGAFYYYYLNSGNSYNMANQTDLAAGAFTEIVPTDAQEALQLLIQGAQKIGGVIFSVDPDHSYTFMLDKDAEKAYLEQRDVVTEQLGRDLGYWESFRLKEHFEDPVTEMIGELLLDFGNIKPFTYMWESMFGSAWRLLKKSAGGTLDLAKKVPVLGTSIRWLSKETAISLGRRIGFHASEVFGVFFQATKDTDSFIKMLDDFGRFNRIPITVRSRQQRLANELAQLARVEEWPRMADRAVESAIKKARDLAKARGVVDPEVLAQITPEPRLVVEELAGRFEALHMDKIKAQSGTRLVSEARSSFDRFFSVMRRTWIEQVLSARPGFTVINYLDSGFRMVLYGGTVYDDLDVILARTDIPREVYMRFPVTEAGADLPLGLGPEFGPFSYFLDNTGTSTISDWPWPIGKRPWVRTKEAAEAWATKNPTLNRIAETLNWGNWGAAWKQYNAWFEFAMSVRLYDSMYWRTFMPLDNAIGERLILQILGSNSDDAQRIARSIWKEAKDNPAKLQELAAESMFGKGAGEGRPMWSWLIPEQLDDWLRGMPPEVQNSFVEGVVEEIRPLMREGNWTPETLRAAFDNYMDDYVREWTMHQAVRGADDVMRGRGGVADDASRRAGQTTIDDITGAIDDITGDTRASEPLKPKEKVIHPVVDEFIELGIPEQGYTGPIAMARALEGGADPSREAIKRVGDLITEGVVVRAEDGTYRLSDELIDEYVKRVRPEGVQVPIDAEQRAAQAGIITPEQQAAADALAEEVETTAKTLQDAIEEVRAESMTQQDLDALNRGGEEANIVKAKRELIESEARKKADVLTARATDEQLLEAMNFENKERILSGERPQPLMSNGAQDYASQEWLRRNPPIDPEDALPTPSTPIGERPDSMTLEGREEILRRMDDDWDKIALAKGDDAVAAREAGLRSRKAMAKAGDAIDKGGDLPPHLAVFWDDIDLMRGRAQDFFRYEIMGADSIKEYFTKTG
ncbi:MAG: hypothetical protein GQ524_02000, partial [Anaerolineales bacterium]|nr:hypothetical protein [Anaerolineales bacterium]